MRLLGAATVVATLAADASAAVRFPLPFRNPVPVAARLAGATGTPTVTQVPFANPSDGWLVAGEGSTSGQVEGEFLLAKVMPGTQALLRTTDGGRTWQPVATPASVQTPCMAQGGMSGLRADGR